MASSRVDYTEYGILMIAYVIIYTGVALLVTYLIKGNVLDPLEAFITGVAIVITSLLFLLLVTSLYGAKMIRTNPAYLS